ncbi:MAG: aminoacyl-histidine dipeptidase [bacterium]|nr:aminoacyl-histidine dipeptidase [bacterium]
MKFEHEKTNVVLKWFAEMSEIPRRSREEEKVCQWVIDWAKKHNFPYETDKVMNIRVDVPGTSGYENSPIVVIQAHVDMVCEKTPDSDHDFTKDPIKLVYDGDWLKADRTTLGADNGIAVAMMMAVATEDDVPHPPLELLFTVDEETGLTGANALEPGFVKGKLLLNIDTEDEGYFTVGCAGGINSNLSVPFDMEAPPAGHTLIKVMAGGMKGGHSGVDINKEKANAIKVLARALRYLKEKVDFRLAHITGGTAHNAIPRDSEAAVFVPSGAEGDVKAAIADAGKMLAHENRNTEPNLFVKADAGDGNFDQAMTSQATDRAIDFILVIPHGVTAMSTDIENLVETSNNLARTRTEGNQVKILTSQRSSVVSRIKAITDQVEAVARLAGGEAYSSDGYPPWPPNMDSPLLAKCLEIYKPMFDKEPVVEVIHAGLECGIIGDKNEGMDMISFGPTIREPHSPDEKILVPTIGMVWDFFAELLKQLK